jgi:hypothetical protein
MQHLVGFNRSRGARSRLEGRSAPLALSTFAQNATFCVTAHRQLADLRPTPNGGSGACREWR